MKVAVPVIVDRGSTASARVGMDADIPLLTSPTAMIPMMQLRRDRLTLIGFFADVGTRRIVDQARMTCHHTLCVISVEVVPHIVIASVFPHERSHAPGSRWSTLLNLL
jgi:hypothetical protein